MLWIARSPRSSWASSAANASDARSSAGPRRTASPAARHATRTRDRVTLMESGVPTPTRTFKRSPVSAHRCRADAAGRPPSRAIEVGRDDLPGLGAGNDGNELERGSAAPPPEHPLLQEPRIVALHELEAPAEVRLDPAIDVGQALGQAAALVAQAA